MTTTVTVSEKGRLELPKEFCKRKRIKPGTALRLTEIGDGLYVTRLGGPSETELRAVLAAAGSLARRQTSAEEDMVREAIADYRAEQRRKR